MRKILALLLAVIMTCSISVTAFAQAPGNVRWDSKAENLNASAGVRFNLVDGICTYKISLYKDGQLADSSIHEIESSDNEFVADLDREIEALGEGSYTATVSTVAGNAEDYLDYEDRDVPVLESATTPTAFVYKEPFHVLPKPTGITVNGDTLTVEYSGPECMLEVALYIDFGNGEVYRTNSGGVNNNNVIKLEHWYKNFYNWVDRWVKKDPVKYNEDNIKMVFKALAFPKNILTYKKSGEYTMTMTPPARAEEEKPVVTPEAPVVTPETKPELALPGANEPEVNEYGKYNPFNNSLFSIVSEFEIPEEVDFPILRFETAEVKMNYENGAMTYMPLLFKVRYDGTTEYNELFDATPDEQRANQICNQVLPTLKHPFSYQGNPGVFNDGVKFGEVEGYSSLIDLSGKAIVTDYDSTGYSYDYNMGLLHEIHAPMGFMNLNYNEYFTIFTKSMTDGTIYEFEGLITGFDNNGYAIMHIGNGEKAKHYVIKLKQGIIPTVTYDGNKILFDQIPVIESGRTLVPLRAIFEAIGADVSWDDATRTVTAVKDGVSVKLTIDNTTASKNGEVINLDVPAKIINGRTMVPVRFIADCFGVNVGWDAALSQVILTSK